MNILSRLSDLLTGPAEILFETNDSPEQIIAQVVEELDECVASARRCAATAIAAERRLGYELQQQRKEAERWQQRAREALLAGREDLARQALERKQEHEALAPEIEVQHAAAQEVSGTVQASLRALEVRAARVRRQLHSLLETGDEAPILRLQRLQSRLTQWEDDLARLTGSSPTSLERALAELEATQQVDQALEALKRDIGGRRQN